MHDLFLEYEQINNLCCEKDQLCTYIKDNSADLINQSFQAILLFYKNHESTYLDYEALSLFQYMQIISGDFKESMKDFNRDMNGMFDELQELNNKRDELQRVIMELGRVKIGFILALLYKLGIPFVRLDNNIAIYNDGVIPVEDFLLVSFVQNELVINPLLYQIFGEETDSFVTFYINKVYNEGYISILEAWDIYKSEDRTCII